ncbi:MAG TPA: site-specific integrase [Bacteroidia bacterium]|nr:site-specific integrase [Bacteroidia bacterium]
MDYEIFKLHHRGMDCIGVRLTREDSRNLQIRKIPGIRWSQTNRCWYGEYGLELEALLNLIFTKRDVEHGPGGIDDEARLSQLGAAGFNKENEEKLEAKLKKFREWLNSKRLAQSTIKTYLDATKSFLRFFPEKDITEISNDDVIKFNNDYILKNNLSASFQNQVVNGIKKFFLINENKVIDIAKIHRPKRAKPLPNVLSKEEIKQLLGCITNLKHQAMLSLTYSTGMRVGELLSLKHTDIDSNRMIVLIRQGKGMKDRIVPLSHKILLLLRDYFSRYKPKTYLFEGDKTGKQYSSRSIQLVINRAKKKAGINKPVTMHWLRHSFATHLHESGTDIRYIQELLGHASSKTTEIYTHVSTRSIQNIKSPFDDL